MILNYLWRMLGDEESVRGLTQEVFLCEWRHFEYTWPTDARYVQTNGEILLDYTYSTDANGQPISSQVVTCGMSTTTRD